MPSRFQKHTRSLYQFFQNVYPTLYQFFKICTRLYTNFPKMHTRPYTICETCENRYRSLYQNRENRYRSLYQNRENRYPSRWHVPVPKICIVTPPPGDCMAIPLRKYRALHQPKQGLATIAIFHTGTSLTFELKRQPCSTLTWT